MQDDLDLLLSRADESLEDLNNVVCVICRLISVDCLPDELAQQCRKWVTTTIGPTLSREAKYYVVAAAIRMYRGDDGATPEEVNWVLAIQPVAEDEVDTWERIGHFLSAL